MQTDNDRTYTSLDQVILDPLFPAIDHRLRTGAHIDMDDIRSYEFLLQAEPLLQVFYEGYGCRLANGQEGYFYLLSEGDLLGRRRLSGAEMLVGQVLALLRMDPAYLEKGGADPDRAEPLPPRDAARKAKTCRVARAPHARAGCGNG